MLTVSLWYHYGITVLRYHYDITVLRYHYGITVLRYFYGIFTVFLRFFYDITVLLRFRKFSSETSFKVRFLRWR